MVPHILKMCGASKVFMKAFKAFKAFIKPFEATQRSMKIKINLIFSLRPGLGWEGLKALGQLIWNVSSTWKY